MAEYPAACEIYQKDFGYLTQLPRFAYMKRTASQTQKIWMETIQQGIDQGLFVKELYLVIVYRFMRDAIWMSVRWQHPAGRERCRRGRRRMFALFLDGFLHAP